MNISTKLFVTITLSSALAVGSWGIGPKKIEKTIPIDPQTGLIVAKGFEEVKANCTVCHSAKFITLQRGDRQTWKDMIVWMQKTQGLWSLDMPNTQGENVEKLVLDYLAKNYAPDDKIERRKNLPISALPVNPYETTSTN